MDFTDELEREFNERYYGEGHDDSVSERFAGEDLTFDGWTGAELRDYRRGIARRMRADAFHRSRLGRRLAQLRGRYARVRNWLARCIQQRTLRPVTPPADDIPF